MYKSVLIATRRYEGSTTSLSENSSRRHHNLEDNKIFMR